jgi:LPXTG-motif cell wall-anchored protein
MLGTDKPLSVDISRILADQHAVAIDIPGLTEMGSPEKLVLDIAYKPVINLVWFGTTLILLGGLIVFFRRNSEA